MYGRGAGLTSPAMHDVVGTRIGALMAQPMVWGRRHVRDPGGHMFFVPIPVWAAERPLQLQP